MKVEDIINITVKVDLTEPLNVVERRVKLAERAAMLPGIQVNDIRRILGVKPLDGDVGDLVLNLPFFEALA